MSSPARRVIAVAAEVGLVVSEVRAVVLPTGPAKVTLLLLPVKSSTWAPSTVPPKLTCPKVKEPLSENSRRSQQRHGAVDLGGGLRALARHRIGDELEVVRFVDRDRGGVRSAFDDDRGREAGGIERRLQVRETR